ncbi:OLC1v1003474C1 [Oldenlandia corymbosa var. corymbosa]|uniref:OLC1v1003474C1 n=1 Tax=Oldenlandia corymbosa var. corymbosa TaxID=529605 RepID=A0AAV1DA54_OLDCO|nr:OLC1v1003474C1 [Oldenlandia corymbosa var. corymbosa]
MSEKKSMYPKVIDSNPDFTSSPKPAVSSSSASSLYPTVDLKDLAENLFPDEDDRGVDVEIQGNPEAQKNLAFESSEEVVIKIPGAIVHLIDKKQSVELASGDFTIVKLKQGANVVAVLARVGTEIQWPLAKDEAAVKLDESHYFFTLRVPPETEDGDKVDDGENVLNYGLTIAAKGKEQERLLRDLDGVLGMYSAFRVEKVAAKAPQEGWWAAAKDVSPEEMVKDKKKGEMVEKSSAAYWTTLAPNVEDYSGGMARMIAAGSGHVVKGILWCGDVTVDRLKWGNEFLKKRMGAGKESSISPETLRRMKRVKKLTKMSEKVATGILSGVVKVSGFFTSSIANSKPGKKFFSLLPGEIVLASLDGFNKVCDAVEVAGKNVMSTTAVVTTGLVNHRYGEKAAEVTHDGLGAAGHAIGTAWAVFKIRKALNPKSAIKPTSLVKANAAKLKGK